MEIVILLAIGYYIGMKKGILAMGISCANKIYDYKTELIKDNRYNLQEDVLYQIDGDLVNLQSRMRFGSMKTPKASRR